MGKIEISTNANKATGLDYIDYIFDGFMELHGDRLYGEDRAIVGGLAFLMIFLSLLLHSKRAQY